MNDQIIKVVNLSKEFKKTMAVKNINFGIKKNSIN